MKMKMNNVIIVNDSEDENDDRRGLNDVGRDNNGDHIDDGDNNDDNIDAFEWGVRTLDFIPQHAFICEVVGQYVYGSSKPLPPSSSFHPSSSSSPSSTPPSSPRPLLSSSSALTSSFTVNHTETTISNLLLTKSTTIADKLIDGGLTSCDRIIPFNMWEKSSAYPVKDWILDQMATDIANVGHVGGDSCGVPASEALAIDRQYDDMKAYLNGQLCVRYLISCISSIHSLYAYDALCILLSPLSA